MTQVTEVGPSLYRISTYVSEIDLQFNQFLVLDDEPLLYHTGPKKFFPVVRDAVATLVEPSKIRWIGFSHLEADECGALGQWQELAPNATAICSLVGKNVSIDDFVAIRPAQALADGEVLATGKHRFRFLQTPHVPHCWDAGHLFEETNQTLLCSDLFHQNGNVEPQTTSDVVGRFRNMLISYQKGPFANYQPLTSQTERFLQKLAALKPITLAPMHGSTFTGDGEKAIRDLTLVMIEVMSAQ